MTFIRKIYYFMVAAVTPNALRTPAVIRNTRKKRFFNLIKKTGKGLALFTFLFVVLSAEPVGAQEHTFFGVFPESFTLNFGDTTPQQQLSIGLRLLFILTILALAPAVLIMLTSFTRIVIVLSFVRRALSVQEVPPTQVIIGLSLFLTFFVMAPTWIKVHSEAIQPYMKKEILPDVALSRAEVPIREFMFAQTRKKDLALFVNMAKLDRPQTKDDVPTYVLVPSFLISELKTAFLIGFLIYVPFLVIDMVVASILLSMGMLMLPPVIISLPFKVILFVLVDGWNLVVGSLIRSYMT